jgi:hypothetical protein
VTGTAVYLYAVTRGPDRPVPEGLTGVSGTPVRTVEHAGLAAVVSSVPLAEYGADALRDNLEDLVWLEQTARAHHAVVVAVAQVAATAPVRLTTIFHDGRRVAGLLDDRGDQIRHALARVAGHAEWGVKVYGDSARPSPEPEPITAGRPGTAYLRQRNRQRRGAEQAARQLAAHAGRIHDTLAARATAVHPHRPQDPRLSGHSGVMLSNTAYLVADRECVGFTAAAERLGAAVTGVEVEVTGPWPAYSFATLQDP